MDTKKTKNVAKGDNNIQGNISEGDMKIEIKHQHYKPEFFSPNLDDYEDDLFLGPFITPNLVDLAIKEKFLVLGGEKYDKSALARHIAWKVLKRKSGSSISVKEWAYSTNPQNLELHIQKEMEPTIFILLHVSPQNVGYDLPSLYNLVSGNHGHYIIISTDVSLERWKLEQNLERLSWQPTPSDTIFEATELEMWLIKRLNEAGSLLPGQLKNKKFKEGDTLIGDIPIKEAAVQLNSPGSIDVFISTLTALDTPLTGQGIVEMLDNCRSDLRALRHWFYHSLSQREQLIAIALCMFEGFYDDQFFSAMEKLVEHSWQKREASLRNLDYCDLHSLSNFYRLNSLGKTGLKRVESYLPEQRKLLLETVWNSHRRLIVSALPVIENLVVDSAAGGIDDSELFGTYKRRRQVRDVMSETLCIIGLTPENSIKDTVLENTLLKLAANENLGIQSVVANAIARWRFYNQHGKLFETLERWQEDIIQKILRTMLDVRYTENSKSPKIFIKATVALTVGFAAFYDPPNKLDKKLYDLIPQLAEDSSNRFVRDRFANFTLPQVIKFHCAQLNEILYTLTDEHYLIEPIGASLAAAIEDGVTDALDTVNSWLIRCDTERSIRYSKDEVTHRDAVLATIAFTYGWIKYNPENKNNTDLIPMDEGFRRLEGLLQKESAPMVREAVIIAIIKQMLTNLETVEQHIKTLFSRMTEEEKDMMANGLVNIHIEQREGQENGEDFFSWHDTIFPVWIHGERPFTAVETVMKKWILDEKGCQGMQMALRFRLSDKLSDFEDAENKYIEKQKELDTKKAAKKPIEDSLLLPGDNKLGTDDKIAIWMVSWWIGILHHKYREKIRILLPIAMKKKNWSEEKLRLALKKMDKYSDNEIDIISDKLIQAIFIANKKEILFPALAIVIIALIAFIFLIF